MANVLDLTIDATGMERGAQQAQQALNKVTQSVKLTDQALNKAFQTTGGTIQVAGGISQTAKALADLNAASAASSAARTLLEIGRTAQDFRELSQGIQQSAATYDIYGTKITTAAAATGRLQSVMMTLGAVVRANPLLAIATAIGAISTAMSVFGDNTKKAADAYGELGAEMRKVRATEAAAEYLGITADTGAQRRALVMRTAEQAMGRGMTMQDLQASGMGLDAMRFLASRGNQQAIDYMRQGGSYVTRQGAGQYTSGMEFSEFKPGRLPNVGLNAAQTQEFLRARARETGMVPTPAQSFSTGQNYGIGGALNQSMQMAMLSAEYKRKEAEDSQRVKENMARAADYAANIGATVGSAFADVLMKTTTLRQAFASIVASIARQGLSDVGAAIFRGAVSGLTPTQAGGNAGLTAPGTTPRN
jgi:hypothetical protein